jgi:hypothetical protein
MRCSLVHRYRRFESRVVYVLSTEVNIHLHSSSYSVHKNAGSDNHVTAFGYWRQSPRERCVCVCALPVKIINTGRGSKVTYMHVTDGMKCGYFVLV